MPYPSLEGRVVAVTGGARWIGRQIAERFISEGCAVAVADIDEEAGTAAHSEWSEVGARTEFIATDVTQEASVQSFVERVVDRLGPIDILVNNASMLSRLERKPFWELTSEEWQRSLDVNLTSMWLTMKTVAPAMIAARRGSIVNMTSGVVYVGRGLHAHFVASKAGVVGLTRATARELGPHGVRVNAIAPSFIETTRSPLSPERRGEITADMALDDVPKPEDIAAAAAFLASDEASHITGQVMSVDSGLTHH